LSFAGQEKIEFEMKDRLIQRDEINEALKQAKKLGAVGVRIISETFKDANAEVGDELERSWVWCDGDPTDERLPGTCCIGEKIPHYLPDAGYWGIRIVAVDGNIIGYGQDEGEIIVENATVIADLTPPKKETEMKYRPNKRTKNPDPINMCMCGAISDYPHKWDCPFPYFGHSEKKQQEWIDARDKLWKEAMKEIETIHASRHRKENLDPKHNNPDSDTDMEVAKTIWSQISTSTKMACGARNVTGYENGLVFQVGASRAHLKISVEYNYGGDDYTVKLIKYNPRTFESKELEVYEGIYNDNLSEVIYHAVNK